MDDSNKTLFELKDDLSRYVEGSIAYKYYSEQIEARKKILSLFGTPYFEEIKKKTTGIQNILKDNGYEDVDLLLKSLIIEGIKLFENLDYQIRLDDDKRFDDYFLGLFNSLKININDRELLDEVLGELESGGENLPPSPLEFLVNYDYNSNIATHNKRESESIEQRPINKEIVNPKNALDTILEGFRKSDLRNRLLKVGDSTPEYTFISQILKYVSILLKGGELEYKEKSFLKEIGVKTDNKESLEHLQENLKSYIINFFTQRGMPINEDYFEGYNRDIVEKHNRDILKSKRMKKHKESIIGKKLLPGHYAFDDSVKNQLKYADNVIKYEIGDEYVPIDRTCVQEIGSVLDANLIGFNIIESYDSGDRFIVVKPTYYEYFKHDREYIKCWIVNVRSQKTGKVYRALST